MDKMIKWIGVYTVLTFLATFMFFTSILTTDDEVTTQIPSILSISLSPDTVNISLLTSEVNFGNIALNNVDDTTDDSPFPFLIVNDGDVKVNVTAEATDIWDGTGGANPSSYYQFRCGDSSEVACAGGSITVWTNMPASASPTLVIAYLDYNDTIDTNEVEIKLTVPSDEPAGSKTSTVTFIASQT